MLLTTIAISKTFPGVRALEAVDFELRAGERCIVVGLLLLAFILLQKVLQFGKGSDER